MVRGRSELIPHSVPQNPVWVHLGVPGWAGCTWVHHSVHRKQLLQVLHLLQGSLYLEVKCEMFCNVKKEPDCTSRLTQVAGLAPPVPALGAGVTRCAATGVASKLLLNSFNRSSQRSYSPQGRDAGHNPGIAPQKSASSKWVSSLGAHAEVGSEDALSTTLVPAIP